ncbi:hypothetical protein APHAL10511_000782 [Amanita phalloides]|nr:hypothetical protein APHAL10511_000782 [Amanita phalloides]
MEKREERRTSLKVGGKALALLTFQTLGTSQFLFLFVFFFDIPKPLGIIYSDIGTSPLYTLNGIWPGSGPTPSHEDVIGGISAIIWALTLLPLLKYVLFSLYFGTGEGEGGTFALYQGLFPPEDDDFEADRILTLDYHEHKRRANEVLMSSTPHKRQIPHSYRLPLLIWCLFGTSLTMADGIFTPAVSVTSAVGGIAVAKPSVSKDIIPISIAFLVLLFLIQQFGTSRISFLFSPVSLVWFIALAGTGIYNITYYPGIFRAFDPSRAVLLFVRTKNYDLLTGVLLAVTGCEAVFANLGQFNAASIRLSFTTLVYPSLLLAYMGQGARLIVHGDQVISNVFYQTIPGPVNGPLYWIIYVLAILATLVASQAMITGIFSLFQQVINTKSFPPVHMLCTSEKYQGQVYIPAVNWSFMILTIIIVGVFANLQNLTNAYGFSVATVMFSTSVLISISIFYRRQLHWILSLMFLIFFGFFDGLFWGAAFKKVPAGAWVPLMIGVILALAMLLWTLGKRLEDKFDGANRKNLLHFIQENNGIDSRASQTTLERVTTGATINQVRSLTYVSRVMEKDPGDVYTKEDLVNETRELVRISTCAVFHKYTRGPGVPHTFVGFIRQWPALPRVVVFLSVCILPIARVPPEEQYVVRKVRTLDELKSGIYGVTYYLGFRDEFGVDPVALADKICQAELAADPSASDAWLAEIRTLVGSATHIVPHYHVVSKPTSSGYFGAVLNFVRRTLIEDVYRRIASMFPETANWVTPADEIIHVGITAFV